MEAIVGSLDAVPSGSCLSSLIDALKSLALTSTANEVRLSATRLVAALLNKIPEGKKVIQMSSHEKLIIPHCRA